MDTTRTAVPTRTPEKDVNSSLKNTFDQAKDKIKRAEQVIQEETGDAVVVTERYVSSHPWKALVVAGSVGFVIGLLFFTSR